MVQDGFPSAEGYEEVLIAARAGASWAFETVYRGLAPAVVGYLRLQGVDDPEDLSSEVFLGVFRGIRDFSGGWAEFRSWVFTIAHRRMLDDRRRQTRRKSVVEPAEEAVSATVPAAEDAAEAVLERLSDEWVERLCDRLSPDQRDVILLRLVADLSLAETALTLRKGVGAVKALQRRGVERLRVILSEEKFSEGVSL